MVDSFFVGLFCLFFAHCIADFSLQSDFIAEYKSKDLWVLVVHCIIYTGDKESKEEILEKTKVLFHFLI